MSRSAVLVLVLAAGGCASRPTPPVSATDLPCPAGTEPTNQRDSDVRWGEVESLRGCARAGMLEGPAVEALSLTSTTLVGRYAKGTRVGVWTQRDARTGAAVGAFTLDEGGSGVEVVRDIAGHSRRGQVVRGKRDGVWTYRDRDGHIVAGDVCSRGALVRRLGSIPWDPALIGLVSYS